MFKGMDRKKREAMAEEMLKRVGLSHRLHHYPSQMSGGQQQRAGIARAFVSRPEVVFADEPTGNLDTKQQRKSWTWSWALPEDLTRPSYW